MVPRCSWSFSSPWNSYVLGHFFVYWERFAVHWDDGRVRPKYATNGVLSWHFGRHRFGFMLTDQGTSRSLDLVSLAPPDAIVTSFRTRAPIVAAYGKPRVNGLRVG